MTNHSHSPMLLNERELYLLLHATDEAARRHHETPRGEELWTLVDKLSKGGACFVCPRPETETEPAFVKRCHCGKALVKCKACDALGVCPDLSQVTVCHDCTKPDFHGEGRGWDRTIA